MGKLRNIYGKTYNKYTVVLEKNKYKVKNKHKVIAEIDIDNSWQEINKVLSDGVRKYLYN